MLIHKRTRDLLTGVKKFIFSKSLLSVLISLSYIVQAIFLGRVVRLLYQKTPWETFIPPLVLIISMIIVRMLLITLNQVYGKWIIGRIKNVLRGRIFAKLLRLGPAYMLDERSGEVESTLLAGVDYLEGYLSLYIPQILTVFFVAGGIITYIFTLNPILAAIILACALIVLFVPYLFLFKITQFSQEHWTAYTDLNAQFVEDVQGMMTLKAFNASKRVGNTLKDKMHTLFRSTMKSLNVSMGEVGVAGAFVAIGQSFSLAYAAYLTAKGALRFADLAVLFFLINEVFRPLTELGAYFHEGFMGITSCDGLFAILDAEEHIAEKIDSKTIVSEIQSDDMIEFIEVDFGYPNSDLLFQKFSTKVKHGEKVAFVGESGSGKTSIIRLLLRFYDPAQGMIKINGTDIKDVTLKSLREQFSIVSQDTYLFKGSIRDNLLLANKNARDAQIVEAAQAANIHDFIMSLPNGYDSIVGEKGFNFSGGQRQRIAIARSILKDSPIVVLDEATSSVDQETESSIQKALASKFKLKTVITIAHRLATIENADRIIVLRDGKIVEQGRHEELIKKKTYYNVLYEAQMHRNLEEGNEKNIENKQI